jgi:3-oxoadipate enol-lactonase
MPAQNEMINLPRFTTELRRQGTGPTLLMIQGGGTGKAAWDATAEQLAPRVSCVAYDNRGVGRASDVGASLSISDLAEDAARVIEAIAAGPVHVCGVSMGGFIAMRLASMRPDLVSTLVLHATAAKLDARTVATGNFRRRLIEMGLDGVPELIRDFLESWAAGPDGLQVTFPRDVVSHGEFSMHNYLGHVQAIHGHHMTDADLAAITAPTLITAGSDDIMTTAANARHLHANIPGSRLTVIQGAGHVYYFEDPVITAALQAGWIAQHE